MPSPSGEEALLGACLRQDEGAWDEFIRRYSKLIFWSIRQTLSQSSFGSRHDLPAELFQEVFQRILEKKEMLRLKDAANIKKFLVVLSAHLTLDRMKAISRAEGRSVYIDAEPRGINEGGLAGELEWADQENPADQAHRGEKQAIVEEVLESLGSRERACLEMDVFDDKTHQQIGQILGIPQDTVSSAIRRAKDKMREKFIKKGLFG